MSNVFCYKMGYPAICEQNGASIGQQFLNQVISKGLIYKIRDPQLLWNWNLANFILHKNPHKTVDEIIQNVIKCPVLCYTVQQGYFQGNISLGESNFPNEGSTLEVLSLLKVLRNMVRKYLWKDDPTGHRLSVLCTKTDYIAIFII